MLQEMAFDFTQTSYDNTHSVIPDLLHSLLLSPLSGLQPSYHFAVLKHFRHFMFLPQGTCCFVVAISLVFF